MLKTRNYSSLLFFCISLFIYCNHISGINLEKHDYGLNVYKKGNCMGCHSWHGKGVRGYDAGVSLRNMNLTLDEIIKVIKCGRP